MTSAIVLLGVLLVVAAATRAAASPAKTVVGLLGTGIIVFAPEVARRGRWTVIGGSA